MLSLTDFSWLPNPPESLPVRMLLALGIAATGAFFAGLVVQVLSKTVTRTKAPGPAVNLVRFSGAAAAGIAAALWLFGSGLGPGKGAGEGEGAGKDKGSDQKTEKDRVADPREKEPDDHKPDSPAGKTILEIDILAPATVEKIADKQAKDNNQRYRVKTDKGPPVLMNLGELKNFIGNEVNNNRCQIK